MCVAGFWTYDAWAMFGVLGGMTLVFYGVYVLLLAIVLRFVPEGGTTTAAYNNDGTAYQTIPDAPKASDAL